VFCFFPTPSQWICSHFPKKNFSVPVVGFSFLPQFSLLWGALRLVGFIFSLDGGFFFFFFFFFFVFGEGCFLLVSEDPLLQGSVPLFSLGYSLYLPVSFSAWASQFSSPVFYIFPWELLWPIFFGEIFLAVIFPPLVLRWTTSGLFLTY